MASEFFARKLNLELALNPLFHGPHEELQDEQPPTKENKNTRKEVEQKSYPTGSNINSFEFKHRNPKGVYDFIKVKMERENSKTKGKKRNGSNKTRKTDVKETDSVVMETNYDKTEMNSSIPEVMSKQEVNDVIPEIVHYPDEVSEGALEVYEPVFVKYPVWKPAKLNHGKQT